MDDGSVPTAARPFVLFSSVLRAYGFAVSPDQTADFVASVGILGPRSMADIHRAARATLGPQPERFQEFDALFRAHFLGQSIAAPAETVDEERAFEPEEGGAELVEPEEETQSGSDASGAEVLAARTFAGLGDAEALRRFRRLAPEGLPIRRSRRLQSHPAGARPDLRRALKNAVKRDGEIMSLPRLGPRLTQRRILLLIDVSGSMKAETDRSLRFAHTLMGAATRCEAFTIGTRLTRITRSLRQRNADMALQAASAAVADWDGGTRLGDALNAFLAIPRYAGFARSAFVVVLSDGLERGEQTTLVASVDRLSRLAWSILWLSPLAGAAGYVPQTEALAAIAPKVRRIGDGSSTAAVAREILEVARNP